QVRDQFGNLRSAANGVTNNTVVMAARLAGSGTLQGTTNMASVNGVVAFTNLSHNVAADITIKFTAGSTTTISDLISVSAAAPAAEPSAQAAPAAEPSAQLASGQGAFTTAQPAALTGIQPVPNGMRITFAGSAGQTYRIERSVTLQLNGTIWTDIGS